MPARSNRTEASAAKGTREGRRVMNAMNGSQLRNVVLWKARTGIASCLIAMVWVLLVPVLALAQSGAGSIQGAVKDLSGAVVSGAKIHVVNSATHVEFDTVSNQVGFYEVPQLFTGTYLMTVTAPGMQTYQTSVELLVAQNAVIDPQLIPGEVSQTVEVNADTIQLTTKDSPAIESTLDSQSINQLPENGRQLTTLLNLSVPGLEKTGTSLNGMNPEGLEFIVDGVPTRNNNQGGIPQSKTELLDPDAVQEVRVEVSNSGAQYATPGTAILSTKSGTNEIHGTLFETARNNGFGIARHRQDPVGQPPPEYIRNEFGVAAGGPLLIPHFYDGRDKTFWFFAYERYSLANNSSTGLAVPTVAMRQGDFSGLVSSAGVRQIIFDPATTVSTTNCAYLTAQNKGKVTASNYCRTPFPGNVIPQSEESPFAKTYFGLIPQPTTGDNPLVSQNYFGPVPVYQVAPQQTFRLDHVFNQSNRAYLRYTHQQSAVNISGTVQNVAASGIPAGAAMGYTNNPSDSYFGVVGFTHVFSSTFFSETILSQQWFGVSQFSGVAPDRNYEAMLGLPNNFGEPGFPNVSGLITNMAGSQTTNAHQSQINSLLDENLTKVIGRHQIVFGGRLTHTRQSNQPNGLADSITWGNKPTAIYDPSSVNNYNNIANTGYADPSLFLGSAGSYSVNLEPPRVRYHEWGTAFYVQDNFHVISRLTLNLGLRYEAHPALVTEGGLNTSFDLKNDAVVLASTPAQLIARGYTTQAIITNDNFIGMRFETPQEAGMPAGTLMNSYNWNFLPRVGAAWTISKSKYSPILRGGYGIYLYESPLADFANHPESNNPLTATYTQSYSTAAQAVDGLPNEMLRYNGPVKFGVAGLNTSGVVNSASTTAILPGPATNIWANSPDWKPVHVQQANVTLEAPLPARSALRLSWVYSKTTDLDVSESYNNAPSTYQWEAATGTVPPTGSASVIGTPLQNTYSVVATNPYDNTTYGASTYHTKDGFANYNALQVSYQRLFNHGSAYQLSYVYAKSLHAGGDNYTGNSDTTVYPDANYPGVLGSRGVVSFPNGPAFAGIAPPSRPSGLPAWEAWHEMIKYQLYELDPASPKLHLKFNGIYDLPVGRGKRFFPNTRRWMDEIIGGFQLAGNTSVVSQVFQPSTSNWGPTNPLIVYKHAHKVNDCSSGVCHIEYQWYNGYISPLLNPKDPQYPGAGVSGGCTTTCISGIPGNYVPYQIPIGNNPTLTTFNSNNASVLLLNGKSVSAAYDAGPNGANYTGKTFLNGPVNWVANVSIFKVFPIREGMALRLNLDAFNVFNMPGENNPDVGTGLEKYQTSYQDPRQLQITVRLTF